MKRRAVLLGMLAVAGTSSAARAQKVWRVGVLTPAEAQWQRTTFTQALQEFGFRAGENLAIDIVSAGGDLGRLPGLATGLVKSNPDVIVAVNTPGTKAAMTATNAIPIVAAVVADPVYLGLVRNIAAPEANVTGVANLGADITTKRIALLKEMSPPIRRVALFLHPDEPISGLQVQEAQRSAASLGVELKQYPMRDFAGLQTALQEASLWSAEGIVRLAGQGFAIGPDTGRLATQMKLPSMLLDRRDVEAGGLMSYFADHREIWRRVAAQVANLARGKAIRDLPFELPTRFELLINLRTCKQLGITPPSSLLARADDVIE